MRKNQVQKFPMPPFSSPYAKKHGRVLVEERLLDIQEIRMAKREVSREGTEYLEGIVKWLSKDSSKSLWRMTFLLIRWGDIQAHYRVGSLPNIRMCIQREVSGCSQNQFLKILLNDHVLD